jgi:hypothetical protein
MSTVTAASQRLPIATNGGDAGMLATMRCLIWPYGAGGEQVEIGRSPACPAARRGFPSASISCTTPPCHCWTSPHPNMRRLHPSRNKPASASSGKMRCHRPIHPAPATSCLSGLPSISCPRVRGEGQGRGLAQLEHVARDVVGIRPPSWNTRLTRKPRLGGSWRRLTAA